MKPIYFQLFLAEVGGGIRYQNYAEARGRSAPQRRVNFLLSSPLTLCGRKSIR